MSNSTRIIATLFVALVLSGCAKTLQIAADTFQVDVVSESAKQKAFKAAKIAYVAWGGPLCEVGDVQMSTCKAGGLQGLIQMYGRLPPCTTGVYVCRTQEAWNKIKEISRKTTALLVSVEPLIVAGSNDVELLLSLPTAVYDAQAAINEAQEDS